MGQTLNRKCERLTIGLDMGDKWSYYCVLDASGDVLLEQKVSTAPKAMRDVFGSMPRCRIALETGTHSPWVSRLLSELGHEAMVAHARSVRLSGKRTVQTSGLPSLVDECIGDYALIEIVWLGDWNEAH